MSFRFKTVAMMMGLGLASSAVAAERTSLAVGPVIIVRNAVRTDKSVGPLRSIAVRTDKSVGPLSAHPAHEGATSRARQASTDSAVLDLNQGF